MASICLLIGSIINPLISIIIPIQLTQMGLTRDSALSELGIITGMTLPLISIPSTIIGALCMILIPRINASKKDLHLQLNYYIKFTIACVFIFIPTFIALGIPICEFIFTKPIFIWGIKTYSQVILCASFLI